MTIPIDPFHDTWCRVTSGQQEGSGGAEYEVPTNIIQVHTHNPLFGGEQSPDSSTSPKTAIAVQVPLSPPGEYEDMEEVKASRDSIRAAQRHQYETVENEEPPEYSHLEHVHGGSQRHRFSTVSATSTSTFNRQAKVSVSSTEPLFDSPDYVSIGLGGSKSTSSQAEATTANVDTEYSHIDHKALQSADIAEREEGPDSEGYHLLPSMFTGAGNEVISHQPSSQIGSGRQNKDATPAAPPSAHRHNSTTANGATGNSYTSIDPTNVKERNSYTQSIVSTDDQYISEQGHVYHTLEQSDEHRRKKSCSSSTGGSPKFRIQEEASTEEGNKKGTIPPYCQVTKSPKCAASEQRKVEREDDHDQQQMDSENASEGKTESDGSRKIPPYSQVDKSKKKNRRPQFDEQDEQDKPEDAHHYHILEQGNKSIEEPFVEGGPIYHEPADTHHYHILEQGNESTEEPLVEGGPIYHTVDHKPN